MLNREDWLMIREMREKGCYLREIAEEVGCSERTVRRALLRGGPPPRRRSGIRSSKLDPYKAQVDRLLAEGVWNATVIFAEIQAMGYRGGISILRDYMSGPGRLRGTFMKSSGFSAYHLFMASMGGTCPRAFWGMW